MNAPFQVRVGARDPFSAFLSDRDSEDVARAVGSDFGWPLERIHDGGVRYAVQTLAVSASPSILLVDLSESADPLEDVNGLAEVCEPGTMVIACGRANDVRLYRQLVSSGIHDYLLKPFTDQQLRDTILDAQAAAVGARAVEAASEIPHQMIAVIGVRGGVGCSTIAVSTAWALAENRKRPTALLDLDVHFGTAALAFDIEPGRGLTDAIENPGRIDGLFIERALVRASDKLGVLSAEAPISQPLTGEGAAFFQLQDELRMASACSVLDLPRHMLVQHPACCRCRHHHRRHRSDAGGDARHDPAAVVAEGQRPRRARPARRQQDRALGQRGNKPQGFRSLGRAQDRCAAALRHQACRPGRQAGQAARRDRQVGQARRGLRATRKARRRRGSCRADHGYLAALGRLKDVRSLMPARKAK